MNNFIIRKTTIEDVNIIFNFIKDLAKYEKMSHLVSATAEDLKVNIFQKKHAEVVIVEVDNKPIGFALFFHNFSTFKGGPGLYLEDIFIKEEMRGNGYGKSVLQYLANIAVERKCQRFEWSCLDWNSNAIKFYEGLGAVMQDEWKIFRLSGNNLNIMANKK
ncbi:MAG: GNAT family N-acetyltransferase [Candidatus Izemoplasma sp.]